MTTPVLFFLCVYLGLKYWPWLKLFVTTWRTPAELVRFLPASETPPPEVTELLGVAARELDSLGYAYQFSFETDNGVEAKRWDCFALPDDPSTFVLVGAPSNPSLREFDALIQTRLVSDKGETRIEETAAGLPDTGLNEQEITVYTATSSLPAILDEHSQRIDELGVEGWRKHSEVPDLERYLANANADSARIFQRALDSGVLIETDGRHFYSAAAAKRAASTVIASAKARARSAGSSGAVESRSSSAMAARCSLVRQQADASPNRGYPILFAVSLVVSLIAFSIWLGWDSALMVLAVILVHELGHYIGMKLCGYKDTKIFFVPMFGGVATGKKKRTTVVQELIVLLLGPLPGMLAALLVLFYGIWTELPEWIRDFCAIAFVINYLNLLPVMPLDGGRIVHALLLRKIPRIGFVFSLLSVVAMAAGAFFLGSWILGILAIFGAIRTPIEWFIGTLTNQVQRTVRQFAPTDLSSSTVSLTIIEAMNDTDVPQALQPVPNRIAVINRILKAIQSPAPSALVVITGCAIYLGTLIVPLVLAFLVFVSQPPPAEMNDEEIREWEKMLEASEIDDSNEKAPEAD